MGNTTNSSSSDYLHECDSSLFVGVPNNYFGFQFAETGVAYAGIYTYWEAPGNGYREYIEVKLLTSLFPNTTYCVKFSIALGNNSKYAIDALGAVITVDSILTYDNYDQILFIPQIENTQGIITDTVNWVLISGEFIANGGEQFITIGNFRNDSNTLKTIVNSSGFYSYYYIDDVSVTLCDTTAVEELQIEDYRLQVYPNPASGNVTITAKGGDEIIITDIAGRKIKEYRLSNNQCKR